MKGYISESNYSYSLNKNRCDRHGFSTSKAAAVNIINKTGKRNVNVWIQVEIFFQIWAEEREVILHDHPLKNILASLNSFLITNSKFIQEIPKNEN